MRKIFLNISCVFLLAIMPMLALFSCQSSGNSGAQQANDSESTTIVSTTEEIVQKTDSLPKEESADEPAKTPAAPKYSFSTTQEALDFMSSSPNAAKYAEGILPRMAEDELSYATKLLNSEYDKFLIIDKQLMRVGLFDKYGREILSYGIACAKNYGTKHKKADSRTPEGFFSVEGIYDSTDWLFTNDNGYTSKVKGQFGPRFIRIKNPVSHQIGLHGTCSPGSIGGRRSHGCIRVTNENILELVSYVTPGMPVIISPSTRDQQVNTKEGYNIPMITMDPYGKYPTSYTATTSTVPAKPKNTEAMGTTPPQAEEENVTTGNEPTVPEIKPIVPDSI